MHMTNENKPNTVSLITYKHSMLTRVVAWVLIFTFTVTEVTYGYDNAATLRQIRENRTTIDAIKEKFTPAPTVTPQAVQVGSADITAMVDLIGALQVVMWVVAASLFVISIRYIVKKILMMTRGGLGRKSYIGKNVYQAYAAFLGRRSVKILLELYKQNRHPEAIKFLRSEPIDIPKAAEFIDFIEFNIEYARWCRYLVIPNSESTRGFARHSLRNALRVLTSLIDEYPGYAQEICKDFRKWKELCVMMHSFKSEMLTLKVNEFLSALEAKLLQPQRATPAQPTERGTDERWMRDESEASPKGTDEGRRDERRELPRGGRSGLKGAYALL